MYVLELCGQRHSWLYSLWTSWKSGMLPSGTLLYCRWYCVQAHMCVCVCVHAHVCVSHSVVSNCLWPHGLQPTRLLCPWNSPGNNSEVGSHSFLQGIFPTQGLNPHLNALQADYLLSEPPGKSLKYTKQINPSVMWLNLSHWSVSTLILWWHFQFLPSLLFNLMFPVLTHMS